MAIIRTDLETGEILQMTDREIKKEITDITGWTSSQYQKEYDKFRNRLKNYEAAIGSKKPKRANEELLRILRKQQVGRELNAEQKAYISFTTASTARFREKAEKGAISTNLKHIANLALLGISNVENKALITETDIMNIVDSKFAHMVQTAPTIKSELIKWLNEVVETKTEIKIEIIKGERVETPIEIPIYRYETASPREINKFLSDQAKDLHKWQKKTYNSNRAKYEANGGGWRRKVGSNY